MLLAAATSHDEYDDGFAYAIFLQHYYAATFIIAMTLFTLRCCHIFAC